MGSEGQVGYHAGGVDTILSVDDVARQAEDLRADIPEEHLVRLAGGSPFISLRGLRAGYGNMEILHGVDLHVGLGQSLCLIGPNGAGKSTVLHSIYGFANIFAGTVNAGTGEKRRDITKLGADRKLHDAGIAYILQDKSVFPNMTVEENLMMGGYLLPSRTEARRRVNRIFDENPRLAARRFHAARILSGGERRLLEISRALVMEPTVLLVDEPSIGLEPRFIELVFEILGNIQKKEGKTIIIVEQNAKKGLEFADIGYVLVSGEIAMAATGDDILKNERVGRLFLGG